MVMSWWLFVALGLGTSFLAPAFLRGAKSTWWWSLAVGAYLLLGAVGLVGDFFYLSPITLSHFFGIELIYLKTPVAHLMRMLVLTVGASVYIYSGAYMKSYAQGVGRFYVFYTLFLFSMLGLVSTAHPWSLFIFWELTSFSSFMLISHNVEDVKSRKSALQALMVTGAGGLCLLAGFMLLPKDLMDMNRWVESQALSPNSSTLVAMLLIFLGAATKSAQWPFHFWLPNAMKAPAPVSSLLHSATMVKAGVFLLAVIDPLFDAWPEWQFLLTGMGGLTLLLGAWWSSREEPGKKMLAYTTLASLGGMIALIGLPGESGRKVAMAFIFAHALYKAMLFMWVGLVEKVFHGLELTKARGLAQAVPLGIAVVVSFAALSMLGVPATMGFWAKEEIVHQLLAAQRLPLLFIFLLSFALMGVAAWQVGFRPLWLRDSRGEPTPASPGHGGAYFLLSFLLLGGVSIPWGIYAFPSQASIWGVPSFVQWGLHSSLIFSVLVWLLVGFLNRQYQQRSERDQGASHGTGFADSMFEQFIQEAMAQAKHLSRVIQSGRLQNYLVVTFITLIAMGGGLSEFALVGELTKAEEWWPVSSVEHLKLMILSVAIMVGASVAAVTKRRLSGIAAMGAVGYSLAGVFALLGAPDLALTQVVVETLSVILFVFLLHEVPLFRPQNWGFKQSSLSFVVSGLLAALVSYWLLVAYGHKLFPSIAGFYEKTSFLEANGRNVVNVILVDFRGFDTMGEISVLSIGAIVISLWFSQFRKKVIEAKK